MKSCYVLLLCLIYSAGTFAGCDITKFRWGCTIFAHVKIKPKKDNLIYCGTTRLYVSHTQFAQISKYQRAGIRMSLMVNDVFYDGPCIPARHNDEFNSMYTF